MKRLRLRKNLSTMDHEEVDSLARHIRQHVELTTNDAKARIRALAAKHSNLGTYADAILADTLSDYDNIPDYFEAVFRNAAERIFHEEDDDNVDMIDGIATFVDADGESEVADTSTNLPIGTNQD